ncbi:hypothetical protein GGI12_005414 [Dipsacomyces acuminosporus]|nr:hypothetical protein GGI12_005414 [Dipsacomyces acuminosporus]
MASRNGDISAKWDHIYVPPTNTEKALFYVALALNLTNFLLIIYAIINRKYLPIKSKQVWITAGIGIGSTIFNISYNVVSGMVGYEGWLSYCRLWTGWFQVTLGLGIFQSLINMRLIIYYRVFNTRKTHAYSRFTVRKFLRRFWPFFVLWFPSLLSTIMIYALPDTFSARSVRDDGVLTCDFNFNYLYWVFSYYAAQVIISWVLYFRMRGVAKAFNEFRTALATIVIFTLIFLANVIINCVGGTIHMWGRVALAFINMVLFNSYFWLILGPPVFGHIFSRESTYRRFLDDMHQDGLIAQEVHLGNGHKQLYGVTVSTDNYVQTSEGHSKAQSSTVSPHSNAYGAGGPYANNEAQSSSFRAPADRYIV